jgi:hypothetical protein
MAPSASFALFTALLASRLVVTPPLAIAKLTSPLAPPPVNPAPAVTPVMPEPPPLLPAI